MENYVRENVLRIALAAQPDPKGNRRVVVASRHVASSENHHHQCRPMANGGITPEAPPTTVHPTVNTRKNVPINSMMYLLMYVILLRC